MADPTDDRQTPEIDVLALEEVLEELEREEPELARIIELRFFAGMTIEQVALATGQSERSVNRQWRLARAELALLLGDGEDRGEP